VIRAIAAAACLALVSASAPQTVALELIMGDTLPPKLSDYRFFAGETLSARVAPYALNTALFSDYSEKDRFVFVPAGQTARHTADGVLDFPVGSALIKTFRYGARKIETRVLLHRPAGWVALPYVWNEDGSEAVLKRAGARVDVAVQGKTISYAVPNVNQCKECHADNARLVPIGPKARNLDDGARLANWVKLGLLDKAPSGDRVPLFTDASAPVAARARGYLDVNCAHCHSRVGSASNSGLYLGWTETSQVALGIDKPPVAAGRGSGGRAVAIDPGRPDASILLYRMASTEPGVAMPEVGRSLVHAEGVALVRQWIASMPANPMPARPQS